MRSLLVLMSAALITACSSAPTRRDPLPPPYGVVGSPRTEGASTFPDHASGALIYSAVKVASDSEYLKSPTATGTCSVRPDVRANVVIPCQGVTLVLKDGSGKILARSRVEQGVFHIYLPAGVEGALDLETVKYRSSTPLPMKIRRGDSISLTLIPSKQS